MSNFVQPSRATSILFYPAVLLVLSALLLQIGCGNRGSESSSSVRGYSFSEEPAICLNPKIYAPAIPLQSLAQFNARVVTTSGLLAPSAPSKIRLAAVEVLDAAGQIAQCGYTDASGNIQMDLPKLSGNYTLRVYSRSESSELKVSVLNNPYSNIPYSIEQNFSVKSTDTSAKVDLPIAAFDGTLEGGAFNIMDQIYKANQFLKNQAGGAIAPKARIYWTPGISPYAYYGYPTSGISFFSKIDDPSVGLRKGLYILGGIQGDVNCSDTDHFDNSVILHEYGHFLEDSFAKSDSPGGSHSGNSVIDPRLAWSEGWSNFFQTAVLGDSYYRDTIGNSACSGGTYLALNLNLKTAQSGQDRMLAGTQSGEGIFRELSVSRELYHLMDTSGDVSSVGLGFGSLWQAFSDSSLGFRNLAFKFRNVGLFNQLLRSIVSTSQNAKLTSFDSAVAAEYQLAGEREFGLNLYPRPGATCTYSLQGVADSSSFGELISNQLKSNDFFEYQYDGTNPTVNLNYSGTNPSDLDLFLYREDYSYGDASDMLRTSTRVYPETSGGGAESLSLAGLPAGTYMINVKVNSTRRGNPATYQLSTDGGTPLCP